MVRVAAHKAGAILIMMNDVDMAEEEASGGADLKNAATVRCVLALRNVLYSDGDLSSFSPSLRVVVQLTRSCPFLDSAAFVAPDGHNSLYTQDLSKFVNSLLFFCANRPGLSRVLLSLLDFDGIAIRTRRCSQCVGGPRGQKGGLVGKTLGEAYLCHGWSNAMLIGVDDFAMHISLEPIAGSPGICGDPDRVLKDDDNLVFVSRSSTPKTSANLANPGSMTRLPAADTAYVAHIQGGSGPEGQSFDEGSSPDKSPSGTRARAPSILNMEDMEQNEVKNVLVCGWRREWDLEPERFASRLRDISRGLAEGSTVTILNQKPAKGEPGCLGERVMSAQHGYAPLPGDAEGFTLAGCVAAIYHEKGDATDVDQLEALLSRGQFCTAICLGSSVFTHLSPTARDTRVLQMLLALRTVTKKRRITMHVIAENTLDQTSTLALGPYSTNKRHPDFVNTQAIVARALCMNLCYPQIWDAVSEFIMAKDNGPQVEFLDAEHLLLAGKTVSVRGLQHVLSNICDDCCVAIGYMSGSKLVLVEDPTVPIAWTAEDRVIAIRRRFNFRMGRGTGGSLEVPPTSTEFNDGGSGVPETSKTGLELQKVPSQVKMEGGNKALGSEI